MKPLPGTLITRVLIIATAALVVSAATPANASKFKVLHYFCHKLNCLDGGVSSEPPTLDSGGNLYGTAAGGAHNQGIVYALLRQSGRWRYKVIYHFCARVACEDGANPTLSALIVDTSGNIYGTTAGGGEGNNAGTVFELSPPVKGLQWRLTTLYSFCAISSNCQDGQTPLAGLTYSGREAGLLYDGRSPLLGTTNGGGRRGAGVAFSLYRNHRGAWAEHVLYAFCQAGGSSCVDGQAPYTRLTTDSSGNLYGQTGSGGSLQGGVAFKLTPPTDGGKMIETVLDNYCLSDCSNAATSQSGLLLDRSGTLFGVSSIGGNNSNECVGGCGLAYKLVSGGKESILHLFCTRSSCGDGRHPLDFGGLTTDQSGNLFGTTSADTGTVFRLKGKALHTLHTFCSLAFCADGGAPRSGLVMTPNGSLVGTTTADGGRGYGTVFELTP